MLDRVPTGITGLDELIQGGIPRNASVLITGTPGAAKTIFALQFVVNGAVKCNERGIFITIEESKDDLSRQFMEFGYDLEKLEKEGKIMIFCPETKVEEGGDVFKDITNEDFIKTIRKFNARRIAVDSLNLVVQFSGGLGGERREIERLINAYKNIGCTCFIVHERAKGGVDVDGVEYGMQDFIVDGIIYLQSVRRSGVFDEKKTFFERRLSILKMRETDHAQGIYQFGIEKDGIHVYSNLQKG